MLYTEQRVNFIHLLEVIHENVKHENKNMLKVTFGNEHLY
jgi:hypothetical protein